MISRGQKIAIAFIVFVSVVAEAFFVVGVLYSTKKFRALNLFLGAMIEKSKNLGGQAQPEAEDVLFANKDFISGLFPSVRSSDEEVSLEDFSRSFEDEGFSFEISADGKSLTVSGDFSKTRKKISTAGTHPAWTYAHTSKILSRPAIFADSVVFVDAALCIVQVKAENGMLVNAFPAGILPSGASFAKGAAYFFAGKNGKLYSASFSKEIPSQKKEKLASASTIFLPDLSAQSKILSKVESWQAFDSVGVDMKNFGSILSPIFDSIQVFPLSGNAPLGGIDHLPKIFAFCPKDSGNFSIAIRGADGSDAEIPSYAAVFSQKGELVASSLDESSSVPFVQAALSDESIFYVVFGALSALEQERPLRAVLERQK